MRIFIVGLLVFIMGLMSCSMFKGSESEDEGMLKIAWRLQSQENVYGFNVYRAESEEGPWEAANTEIIPGHDTTSIPHWYEFYDTGIEFGKTYYYYIEEVTTDGKQNTISPVQSAVAKSPDNYSFPAKTVEFSNGDFAYIK